MNKGITALVFLAFSVGFLPVIFAESTVEIILEKSDYSYGEKLFYTIKVSEITGDNAIIHIRDEFGKGSSAIPIPISQLETPVPSLYPFEKQVFPEGKFFIDVDYSGASSTAEFTITDRGNVVIPFWAKQVAYNWISPQSISDNTYAGTIQTLIDEKIISVSETHEKDDSESSKIPSWFKTSTLWWLEEKISDDEYANSLQYMIKSKIIIL